MKKETEIRVLMVEPNEHPKVVSRIMRKIVCRLWQNKISQQ